MLELQFFFLDLETSANEMSNVLAIVLFWFGSKYHYRYKQGTKKTSKCLSFCTKLIA